MSLFLSSSAFVRLILLMAPFPFSSLSNTMRSLGINEVTFCTCATSGHNSLSKTSSAVFESFQFES